MSTPGTDWAIDAVVKVTDGDSLRVRRRRTEFVDGLRIDITDDDLSGAAIRLVTLDTPERGDNGYQQARTDVINWINSQRATGAQLRIETWSGGGFDRLLGDIYAGDRSNTLSQWMLRERGWLPYVRGV